jgi:hypothetical protein
MSFIDIGLDPDDGLSEIVIKSSAESISAGRPELGHNPGKRARRML